MIGWSFISWGASQLFVKLQFVLLLLLLLFLIVLQPNLQVLQTGICAPGGFLVGAPLDPITLDHSGLHWIQQTPDRGTSSQ